MRRATALVPLLSAILAAAPLAPAPIAGAAPAARKGAYSVEFTLHAEGFLVRLGNQADEETVVLSLTRGGEFAYYEAKATITPTSIEARFGQLGELDLQFRPVAASNRKGTLGGDGTFEGTIAFTGENGYVHLDAERARGSLQVLTAPSAPGSSGTALHRRLPADAAPLENEVNLEAVDRTGRQEGLFLLARGLRTAKGVKTDVYGGEIERREGMSITRGAGALAGQRGFEWDLAGGRATVDPPKPFTGAAVFRRPPHGRARWSGSLRVPILGRSHPLRLTGNRFRAKLVHPPPD